MSKIVNVIPILAKGDCYTIEEVKEIKNRFIQKFRKWMIMK